MKILVIVGIGSVLLAGAAQGPTTSQLQEMSCPNGKGAERFGPAMSPGDSGKVYSSVLSPDGKEFYFFKLVGPGHEDYRIFRSRSSSGHWTSAELLDLGGDYSDLYPAPSPDGKRLVFASYRPAPDDTSSHRNAHLWYVVRIGHDWAEPRFIRASTYGYYHSGLTSEADGSVRYNRTTPDWGSSEQFRIRWLDTAYSSAEKVPPHPAAEYWRGHLGDSSYVWGAVGGPDGIALVQVSRVAANGRRSPAVYFVSRQQGNEWSDLVPAGGGLGEGSPNFIWFSRDSCYVHFTRDYSSFVRVPLTTAIGAH
jgi:hypothetical protein